jgi:hypothetical protein
MEANNIEKIETTYLSIFKICIIVLLTLALIVSAGFLIKGVFDSTASERATEPAKLVDRSKIENKKPVVVIDGFLEFLNPKDVAVEKSEGANDDGGKPNEQKKSIPVRDPVDVMVDKALDNLWIYVEGYQKACAASVQIDKETFFNSFPKQVIRNWFKTYGESFMASQDSFEKLVLSDTRIIEICKKKEGRGQVFTKSLDWHYAQYSKKFSENENATRKANREADELDSQERQRVENHNRNERLRVEASQSEARYSLFIAASAFGTFMSLALLLILSKIEYNLRGFNLREPGVQ